VLRRIFGLRGTGWQRSGEDYITRNFMFSIPHNILFMRLYNEEYEGQDM
jgi:hypothetical protein